MDSYDDLENEDFDEDDLEVEDVGTGLEVFRDIKESRWFHKIFLSYNFRSTRIVSIHPS